jgi:hypothetical protein
MAPELLALDETDGKSQPNFSTDVYALSMVAIEVNFLMSMSGRQILIQMKIFTGDMPFGHVRRDQRLLLPIVHQRMRPARPGNSVELGLSDVIWEVLKGCWDHDSAKRPRAQSVLERL